MHYITKRQYAVDLKLWLNALKYSRNAAFALRGGMTISFFLKPLNQQRNPGTQVQYMNI